MKSKQLKKDFYWVGALDPDLRIFDIVVETEFGTSYNAYILKGSEKTVLFEASKSYCYEQFVDRVEEIVPLSEIDYLVVSHTEPDHTGTIERMLDANPKMELLGSQAAMNFLKEIVNKDYQGRVVKDGEEISLGNKTLKFITAPNLHWPDTIFTYIPEDKTLVTCDAFGCHFSDEGIVLTNVSSRGNYEKALKVYYDAIMSPFKGDILKALDKIKDLDIDLIATGHGPVIDLKKDVEFVIGKYNEWSSIESTSSKPSVAIVYVSAYGYTKILAEAMKEGIESAADIAVSMYDLVDADQADALNAIANSDGFLLGTPTMVGEALKPIWDIATSLVAKVHGGKIASAFGSFGWSGEGVPHIMDRLKQVRLKVYKDGYKCRFKPNEEQYKEAVEYGKGFGLSVLKGEIIED